MDNSQHECCLGGGKLLHTFFKRLTLNLSPILIHNIVRLITCFLLFS